MPDRGYTPNKYMNLFIATSHVYYDYYNNGVCNLEDCYLDDIEKHITPFIRFTRKTVSRKPRREQIERLMDKTTDIIKDKDLSFEMFQYYMDYDNNTISRKNTSLPDKVTFGFETELIDSYNNRIEKHGYKEIKKKKRAKSALFIFLIFLVLNIYIQCIFYISIHNKTILTFYIIKYRFCKIFNHIVWIYNFTLNPRISLTSINT